MEQPVTTIAGSSTATPASINEINEMLSITDATVLLSSSSPEIERSQPATIKSVNRRARFPVKLYLAKRQSDTQTKNADNSRRNYLDLKRCTVPSVFSRIKTKCALRIRPSAADGRLKEIIQKLNENPVEETFFKEEKTSMTGSSTSIRQSRRIFRHLMEQPKFHYTINVLIVIDLIVVFTELIIAHLSMACLTEKEIEQYNITKQREACLLPPTHSLEAVELFFYYISLTIISIFVLEILTAYYAFGWRRYTKILYLLDAFVVFISFILEVYFHFGSTSKVEGASASLIVLRLWKIIRVIHAAAHSVSLRNQLITREIKRARSILQEENLQAEKIIRKQEIQIDNLMHLLRKTGIQIPREQSNEFPRRRTKSVDSVTLF